MKGRQIGRVNQQSKGETPLVGGILQRAAVRSVADQEVEAGTSRESRFQHDFSQMPIRRGLPIIQAKLKIGAVGDKYEQEADRVAQEVVSRINAPASAQSTQGQSVQRQGQPQNQGQPDEELQAKPSISDLQRSPLFPEVQREAKSTLQSGEASTDLESAINSARGSGQPLEAGLQRSIGQAIGADFSGVRVHTDAQSDQLNRSIQAKAFTTGQDVFFRQGAYDPGSRGGQELIAHELTHVMQQNGGTVQRFPAMKAETTPTQDNDLEDDLPDFNAPIEPEADIRTEGYTGIVQRVGDVVGAAIVFPSYADIVGNATIRQEVNNDWQATLNATTVNSRREQGFWIRWNSGTGNYSVTGRVVAPAVGNAQGATINLPAKPADAGAEYTVASFHTHTPTKYRNVGRAVGPSGADINADTGDNVAGVVYDYADAGGGNIPARHPLRAPAHLYHSGPNRRV
ncbi:MAG: DUF4157 domain-containing protein [Goleter apudmare HA4340-LM2]|jgi:hypothetical protein|nr:DUF4157 domain-containing protein [Goleter apudmare HA4340-LM2]